MIPPDDALHALELYSGWVGGFRPIDFYHPHHEPLQKWYKAVTAGLPDAVRVQTEFWDPEVLIGLPRPEAGQERVQDVSILWTQVKGDKQVMAAARLRPLPTIVLRVVGSTNRVLIWALEEAVNAGQAVDANSRLAYAVRATYAPTAKGFSGRPDDARFPAPGTPLRFQRSRPAPVICTRLSDDVFPAEAVVGGLKAPPAPPTREEIAEMRDAA